MYRTRHNNSQNWGKTRNDGERGLNRQEVGEWEFWIVETNSLFSVLLSEWLS